MSVLLWPIDVEPALRPLLTVVMALAGADACLEVAGVEPDLKWPNDLLVGGRKLGGILAESDQDAVVVGMGINTVWPRDLPDEIAATATALNHVSDRPVDRDRLLACVLDGIDRRYPVMNVVDEYRQRCTTIGEEVRVERVSGELRGTATDIDDVGHLVVRDGNGVAHTVTAGDVVHVRPAD
jgi:BirA family biotin operon repressor/biotin-[acetyl-CoA-carboxylase] ligase